MTNLRPVAGLKFPDIEPGGADMAKPEYAEVEPTSLLVDETYQRNLSERSRVLIRRLVASWDWRAYKPPSVVRVGDDLHVIDGQHTAIAAASHPLVGKIPVLIVDAPEQSGRAAAFVKLNRDRISVTQTQLHHALVQAGDEDAVTMAQVCERAGVRILKAPPGNGYWEIGDAVTVTTIKALISRRHAMGARRVLEILVKAKMAPLSMAAIRAVEALLFEPEYAASVDPEDLATALRDNLGEVEREARHFAAEHGARHWRALTAILFRKLKRSRRGHRTAA